MTCDEAMAALNVSGEDDATAVESVFRQRTAALAGQIAAAPTPSLREKYEQQVARLRQAPTCCWKLATRVATPHPSR
jgi:hypothetical protein